MESSSPPTAGQDAQNAAPVVETSATVTGERPPAGQSNQHVDDQVSVAGSPSAAVDGGHPSGQNLVGKLLFNVVVPLILLGIGVGVIAMLGQVEPAPRPKPENDRAAMMQRLPGVTVMPMYSLEDLDANLELTVDGEVVPYREVSIATEVAGKIIFKSDQCEAGSVVQAGDVLMRIDPTDYQLELERLTRSREQAYQAVRETQQDRTNTKRLIEVALRDIELQERDVKRQKALKGYATAVELDRAERAVLQARQQLVTLENQLESQGQREASLDAALRVAETQLKSAEVNLKRTEVVAPIDGVIVREDAELNTFVARGNPIVTIEDTSKVEVASSLRMDQLYWISSQSGDDAEDVEAGYKLPETPATIEFEVSGRNDLVYRWEGRLVGYDGIGLDATTRTVPVRILVDRPRDYSDSRGQSHQSSAATPLVRGMFVTVGLQVRPQVTLTVVPEKAIKPGNRLWVFQPDESVLEPPEDAASDSEEKLSSTPQGTNSKPAETAVIEPSTDDEASQAATFDMNSWMAGRVRTVNGIVAVNMLRQRYVPDMQRVAESVSIDSGANVERKWWICEIPDGSTFDDGFVVVSPLGTIPDDGLPARIATVDEEPESEQP